MLPISKSHATLRAMGPHHTWLSDPGAGRRRSLPVYVGGVTIGGSAPIVVQSMTDTDTADVEATARQTAELARAGAELVRVAVDRDDSAAAVPRIRDRLDRMNVSVPLIGDFHYIGDQLLAAHPACAEALAKYRINPGNVGFGEKRDARFASIVEQALRYSKPVRIGVNWGSLDQALLSSLMDKNNRSEQPESGAAVAREAIVQSALLSAKRAEELGVPPDRIIISAKVSDVQELIAVYEALASRCVHALHLGLTEAGMGMKGIVASAAASGILLQRGIGDTVRFSLTPPPGASRTEEVRAACALLQSLDLRRFSPSVVSCPGCGRTDGASFRELARDIQDFLDENMPEWQKRYPGVEGMTVAVMGCVVNGPGESKHANIGISLPGAGEARAAPIFVDGKKTVTLRGGNLARDFKTAVMEYVKQTYGTGIKP